MKKKLDYVIIYEPNQREKERKKAAKWTWTQKSNEFKPIKDNVFQDIGELFSEEEEVEIEREQIEEDEE